MPHPLRRRLTSVEVALARSIFGDAIDYGAVRLVLRRWFPFQLGWPSGVAALNVNTLDCLLLHVKRCLDIWSGRIQSMHKKKGGHRDALRP